MFAVTPRLTLRPGWPEDAAALTHAIAHEAVAMKLARLPWPYQRADAETWLSTPRGPTDASFIILDRTRANPAIIGGIGLRPLSARVHELGYWLTPSAWGRGYATEAGHAVLDMARHALPIRRIEATHHLDNPASRRVLVKLGFREVRHERHHSLAQRRDVDCAVLALDLDADDQTDMPMAA